jgi:hypothetical protein
LYFPDEDGKDNPVTTEFVKEFIGKAVGRFLLDFKPGHTVAKVNRYEDFVIAEVISCQVDYDIFSVLQGYRPLLMSTLLTIYLHHRLSTRDGLSRVVYDIGRPRIPDGPGEQEQLAYQALVENRPDATVELSTSVHHIVQRYQDLVNCFPATIDDETLWLFAHWFLNKGQIDEVTAITSMGKKLLMSALMKDSGLLQS